MLLECSWKVSGMLLGCSWDALDAGAFFLVAQTIVAQNEVEASCWNRLRIR